MVQAFTRLGKLAIDVLHRHREPDWASLRGSLLLAAGDWLWRSRVGDAKRAKPALLSWPTGPWQAGLNASLEPMLKTIFTGRTLWHQLETLALLSEQAAPAAIRRQAGIYYTPGPVADFVVGRAFAYFDWLPEQVQNYLDPACGSGLFLWKVFARIADSAIAEKADLLAEWIKAAHGCDTDELALAVAGFGFELFWAERFPELAVPRPRLRRLNALAADAAGQLRLPQVFPELAQLGLLISNPPYVGERSNKALFEPLRQPPWNHDYRGRSDLYYYFFFLALSLSRPETLNALLTPSYFKTATAAAHLRQRLKAESRLLELVDFGDLRLFSAAGGHHSLLTIFTPARPGPAVRVQQAQGTLLTSGMNQLTRGEGAAEIAQAELFSGSDAVLSWHGDGLRAPLERMARSSLKLEQIFQVNQGIVSGADSLSAAQRKRLKLSPAAGSGIFVLDPAERQKLLAQDPDGSLAAWFRPWFKNSDVRPWTPVTAPRLWLIYAHRGEPRLPPPLETHLAAYRPLLEQRREVQLGRIPWWQLQWPREPERFGRPKLLLPQRAKVARAAYTESPWYASADVYYIFTRSDSAGWSLQALCALLNSPLYTCWWYHRGKRKGGLIELYHQPLTQTPLPEHPDIPRLESLFARCAAAPADPALLAELHSTVCSLFGLGTAAAQAVWSWYCGHKGA